MLKVLLDNCEWCLSFGFIMPVKKSTKLSNNKFKHWLHVYEGGNSTGQWQILNGCGLKNLSFINGTLSLKWDETVVLVK